MNKCLERVNGRYFWNFGVFSSAMIPRCHLHSRVFFFIVASIDASIDREMVYTRLF